MTCVRVADRTYPLEIVVTHTSASRKKREVPKAVIFAQGYRILQ
jgi:hypothetical protein